MKRLLNIDLFAGVTAVAWAIVALTVLPQLNEIVDYRIAATFGLAALGRFVASARKTAAIPQAVEAQDTKPEDL